MYKLGKKCLEAQENSIFGVTKNSFRLPTKNNKIY